MPEFSHGQGVAYIYTTCIRSASSGSISAGRGALTDIIKQTCCGLNAFKLNGLESSTQVT